MMVTRRAVLISAFTVATLPRTRIFAAEEPASPTVLRLVKRTLEVNGKLASVYGIRQADGTEGLVSRVGQRLRVRVENQIGEPSLIHWHGLAPPWQQDGVAGISGPAIPSGGGADYNFPLNYGGTFWMHSHQGLQEQLLLDAPLIIRDARDHPDRQEVVLRLNDFSFIPPAEIFANLKKGRAMPGMAGGPMPTMPAAEMGGTKGMAQVRHDAERPKGPDLNDVDYQAFLANDHTLDDPEIVKVEPGAEVLLRVINASAMSSYHFDLGRLEGRLIAVDGTKVEPVAGRRFPINVAQRLDLLIPIPRDAAAYPLLATVEGKRNHSGIVLVAGKARVARVAPQADLVASAITMQLEQRLRAAEPLKPRRPDRVHTIDLTGLMSKYIWSINGVPWTPEVPPLPVIKGERVALVMTNSTGMPHPMHLHGHRFQVVEVGGVSIAGAVRDTVRVPPGERVVVVFDADNPGTWAFHCHMLYHMAAGMFQTLRYV